MHRRDEENEEMRDVISERHFKTLFKCLVFFLFDPLDPVLLNAFEYYY